MVDIDFRTNSKTNLKLEMLDCLKKRALNKSMIVRATVSKRSLIAQLNIFYAFLDKFSQLVYF